MLRSTSAAQWRWLPVLLVTAVLATFPRPANTYIDLNEPDDEGYAMGRSRRVHFWLDTNFQGEQYTLHLQPSRCYRIAGPDNNQFSSVNPNGQCIELYTRSDCFGAMYRMDVESTRCHRNLGDCDMNDAVSSVRLCKEQCRDGSGDNRDLMRMLYEIVRSRNK